jgi:hypothetical protein
MPHLPKGRWGKIGFEIPSGTQASALYFQEILSGTPLRWALPAATTSPATTLPTASSALTVVQEYFAAINARDFQRAWDLGGKNLSSDYATFVNGFSNTASSTLTSASSQDDTVDVTLEATQTSGERQTYQGTYTVRDGVIVSANVRRS